MLGYENILQDQFVLLVPNWHDSLLAKHLSGIKKVIAVPVSSDGPDVGSSSRICISPDRTFSFWFKFSNGGNAPLAREIALSCKFESTVIGSQPAIIKEMKVTKPKRKREKSLDSNNI